MSLTPEEKQRIYEEEKARLEAQERVRAEIDVEKAAAKAKKEAEKKKQGCMGCLFLILIVVGTGIYFGTRPSSNQPAQRESIRESTPSQTRPNLEVLDSKSQVEEHTRYVVGTVRNNTYHTYGYVQVEINLYDSAGNQVGSTLANTNNLEPGAIWKFKAIIIEDRATKFRVVNVTGF
jgi:hypothetical protein